MTEAPMLSGLLGRLRARTTARVGLGLVGTALPTQPMLEFQLAHARARDAVHAALVPGEFGETIGGLPVIEVHSRAPDRATYLRRPDLGRQIDHAGKARLSPIGCDLALIVADGLSATAVRQHAASLVAAITDRLAHWRIGPVVVAHQARVAIGDEIGAALDARMAIVLIGERPGLSAADSMSAYLTWAPERGRVDSERNCVSNIRPPHGMRIEGAAATIAAIAEAARSLGRTGVALPDAAWQDWLAPRRVSPATLRVEGGKDA